MNDYSRLIAYCEERGIELTTQAPMVDYTTFRVGGSADVLALPKSEKELVGLVRYCLNNGVSYTVLGRGSNVLVSDSGIEGLVIVTSSMEGITLEQNNVITCLAGTPLIRLCRFALEHSLTGLEFAYGIPGSAGGAAYMNAGAYGGEMKDVLISCTHLDAMGNCEAFYGEELQLGYRHSTYAEGEYVILSLTLQLQPGDPDVIRAKMEDLLGRRKEKQPLDKPSAGSTFKRPEGYFAGALIEQCGLKGFTVGGAQVSEKHAGFVVNNHNATAADIQNLVAAVQQRVLKETGITLEPEIKMIGR